MATINTTPITRPQSPSTPSLVPAAVESPSASESFGGIMTASITWMIPLEVCTSANVMFAPSMLGVNEKTASSPLTIRSFPPSVMSAEDNVPA